MKSTKILMMAFVPVIMVTCLSAVAQTNSLAGTWKINLSRSEFGGAPTFTLSKKLEISESQSLTTIRRTAETADGVDSVAVEAAGTGHVKASAKKADGTVKGFTIDRSEDGKMLTQAFTYSGGEDELTYEGTETLTLSADGKSLTAVRHIKASNDFEYTVKGWYDRSGD